MKRAIPRLAVAAFVVQWAFLAVGQTSGTGAAKLQEERLQEILANLKVQALTATNAPKYEVSVPASSAGARGAEIAAGGRFAVAWPGTHFSPLTALTMNLSSAAAKGGDRAARLRIYAAFKESFPEYGNDALLKELGALLGSK